MAEEPNAFDTQIETARQQVYADCDRIGNVVEVRIAKRSGRWSPVLVGFADEWITRREAARAVEEAAEQRKLDERAVNAAERAAGASEHAALAAEKSARMACAAAIISLIAVLVSIIPGCIERL